MEFRIADTFTYSLARLTDAEQKAVKTTAFDLQTDPATPGMRFHKLDRAKDKRFWSVRVNDDLRLIVHRTDESLLLCYVDHHDKAYAWAERRKLETHPRTGAAQLVEIRERVQEIVIPTYVADASTKAEKVPLLANRSDDELLGFGVPREWLGDVRAATEDDLLTIADHLPAEAAEAVLELATGGRPRKASVAPPAANPFEHPDAQRRFRLMTDSEELARALEYPWEKWTVFLHPAQRELVERDFNGPARIAGSAGTGKTIVAIHRAVHVARSDPDARVLLTTFSEPLANALGIKLERLIGTQPRLRERIDLETLDDVARHMYELRHGRAAIASKEAVASFIDHAARSQTDSKFPTHFLMAEWEQVVDTWQLRTWEAYRDVARLGRKTRLPEKQRRILWSIFEGVRQDLDSNKLITHADLLERVAADVRASGRTPYDFVVVDEAQDVSVAQLRFVAALGERRPDALFFAGDLGQRIFQAPFSWKSLGVDVRGRAGILRVNYRTSHQIRSHADRLLPAKLRDVDGNEEDRQSAVSVFSGPEPHVVSFRSHDEEVTSVGQWLADLATKGVRPDEMLVLIRSEMQIDRAKRAVSAAGLVGSVLDESLRASPDSVAIGTMHLSKGLEYRAVAVMACDDDVLPLQERIEIVGDDSDLEEVYDTERHLLYVASTRARDYLWVSGVEPTSEFLVDLQRPIKERVRNRSSRQTT